MTPLPSTLQLLNGSIATYVITDEPGIFVHLKCTHIQVNRKLRKTLTDLELGITLLHEQKHFEQGIFKRIIYVLLSIPRKLEYEADQYAIGIMQKKGLSEDVYWKTLSKIYSQSQNRSLFEKIVYRFTHPSLDKRKRIVQERIHCNLPKSKK